MTLNSAQGNPRLLVVDDSRVMRTAAKKMLGSRFDVVTAEDGLDGWQKIQSDQTIQVIFTDLSMPEMDGYELLKKIRTDEDAGIAGLPVIIVTGAENDEQAREQALDMGATDFISKPFNSTDLTARATAHANYQRERKVMAEQATLDALTGLGNKLHFDQRLKQELALSARQGHKLSVLRVDIDGFKTLFLKAGKDVADAVLKQVGAIMAELLRKEDTAARTGLNQFAVLLPTADSAGAAILANRLCRQVRDTPVEYQGHKISITLSAGVLTPEPRPGATPRSIIGEANTVMQAAVAAGGNRVITEQELRQEGAASLPSASAPPSQPEDTLTVENALTMLAEGKVNVVRAYLPQLRKRLSPLLKLLIEEQQG